MQYPKLGLAALFLLATTASHAQQVYSNDFSGSAGSEWSNPIISTSNGERFLADNAFGSGAGTNTLTLTNLPAHSSVTVGFDLYIIQSMDGNGPGGGGPDFWTFAANGNTLLNTTFANYANGNTQAFVSQTDFTGNTAAPRTGAFDNGHLGFGTGDFGDSTYRFLYTFNDTSPNLALAFTSLQNQGAGDEGWGLDNVTVTLTPAVAATPEPGSLALVAGLSLSGSLFALRRRSRKRA